MTYPDAPQDPPSTSPEIDLSNIPPPVFPEPKPPFRPPVKKILLWSGIALAGAGLLYGINSMASQKNKAVAQSLKKKEQESRLKQQREQERLRQVQNAQRYQTVKARIRAEQKRTEPVHQQPDYAPYRQAIIETRPLKPFDSSSYEGTATFSPDGNYLITQVPYPNEYDTTCWGCQILSTANFRPVGETIKIYDKNFPDSKFYQNVTAAAYTPDQSALLLVAGGDAVFYNFRTKDFSAPIKEYIDGSHSIDFSSDGKHVALTTTSRVNNKWVTFIAIHDARTGKKLQNVCLGEGIDHHVDFLPQGDRLLAMNSQRIELIGIRTGRTLWSSPYNKNVQDARLNPAGHMFASLIDENLEWWNTETGELMPVQPHNSVKSLFFKPKSCRFSPDGKRLMIVDYKKIVILDTATGRLVGQPMEHDATINTACFTPNSRYVITSRNPLEGMRAEDPCEVQIWETETGNKFGKPMQHQSPPVYMEVSKDGKYLLTQENSIQGGSQIWNISKTTEAPQS